MKPFPAGLGVAIVTPFDAHGAVDFDALATLVDFVIDGGVDYVVALGTTAETPALFIDERKAVLAAVKQFVRGRVPLVAGIGGNNTAGVVRAVKDFDLSGVDALLSVTPFYNKPSQQGLYDHFTAIAKASPIPVILYNIPSRTGVNMMPETTLKLAHDLPNIAGIKEACGNLEQIKQIINGRPEGFCVISGDDSLACDIMAAGGDGVISVAANAFPRVMAQLTGDCRTGDFDSAAATSRRIAPLIKSLFAEGNPTGIKAALAIKGIICNHLRLPLVPATDGLMGEIATLTTSLAV